MPGIEISPELNNYRLAGVLTFLELGTSPAYVEIYGTVRPAPGAAGGPPLVTIPLAEPFGTIANGLLLVSPTPNAMVANSGVAVWGRIFNGAGAFGWDCDVSDTLGTGQLKLASTTLYAGGMTQISSGVLA